MMQQLAAKQSDIAALDLGNSSVKAKPETGEADPGFTAFIRQVAPDDAAAGGKQQSYARNSDAPASVTRDAKQTATSRVDIRQGEKKATLPDPDPLEGKQPLPGDPDTVEEWVKEQDADIDWLAYVDAVKSADEKLAEGAELSDVSELGNAIATGDEEALVAQAMLALKEFDGEQFDPESMVKLVDGSGKAMMTSVRPVIDEIMAKLAQADGDAEASDEMKALAGVLLTMQKDGKITLNKESALAQLAETLPADGKKTTPDEMLAKLLTQANTESGDTKQQDKEQALLASLVKNEIAASKSNDADAFGTSLNKAAESTSDARSEESLKQLMQDMQTLSTPSAEELTEAFSDNIVALMPTASSEQQQQVKSALVAGIKEIQQQLAKGHEPGIDLKSMIQQAMAEANISQTQSVMAQIEQQAAQLHQLANTTQQTMQQVVASQMVSADTLIQENSQVRSEAGKAQKGADGIDPKPVNIHRPEGQQQLQEKIRWMVDSRRTLAEIRLDPPELGSMQVRVNVNGDAASVSFVVQSQQAKDALNDAMPRLRDMLSEQGIELGESFVQQDQGGEAGEQAEGQFAGGSDGAAGDADDDEQVREQPLTRQETGGIDYYA